MENNQESSPDGAATSSVAVNGDSPTPSDKQEINPGDIIAVDASKVSEQSVAESAPAKLYGLAENSAEDDSAPPVVHAMRVACIGASAGGLDPIRAIIEKLDQVDEPVAYIVAQHRSRQYPELLTEILEKSCELPVLTVSEGMRLEPNKLYVLPSKSDTVIQDGKFRLRETERVTAPKPSIDRIMHSVAQSFGANAVGVVLSGTGSDGSFGCRAIKAEGGAVIVQNPDSAQYSSMPLAVIDTGVVDLRLESGAIAGALQTLPGAELRAIESLADDSVASKLEDLFRAISNETHIDFNEYKVGMLERRIMRRLHLYGDGSISSYVDAVVNEPGELRQLARSFLICVTEFFRDKNAFEALKATLADLLRAKRPMDPIRIWVPGCATGEEAYSIAILVCEILGDRIGRFNVRIFGTDLDQPHTDLARIGLYPAAEVENIEKTLREKYFEEEKNGFRVIKKVRDLCVFARQDVLRDPPFTRADLISCRNLMIYFETDVQQRILEKFHYALNSGGVLFLGKSESLHSAHSHFAPVDERFKIFRRRGTATSPTKVSSARTLTRHTVSTKFQSSRAARDALHEEVRERLLADFGPPAVLVTKALRPLLFYGDARRFLTLPDGDADFSLLSLCAPPLRAVIRMLVEKSERGENDVEWSMPIQVTVDGAPFRVRVSIRRMWLASDGEACYLMTFDAQPDRMSLLEQKPISPSVHSTDQTAAQRIVELEEELSASREYLQSVISELETSNEELQSINEEMQSSTEELQASNEELETGNEELQATNEELTTVNDELESKRHQLDAANLALRNLQESVNIGIVVVDHSSRITMFNKQAVRVFGMVETDVGQSLIGIPCYFAIPELRARIDQVIQTGEPVTETISRESSYFLMQVAPYVDEMGKSTGAVLSFMDYSALYAAEQRFRLITDALSEVVWMTDEASNTLLHVSPSFERVWGMPTDVLKERPDALLDRVHEDDLADVIEALADTSRTELSITYRIRAADGFERWIQDNRVRVSNPAAGTRYMVGSAVDVTERVTAERKHAVAAARFGTLFETLAVGVALIDRAGRIFQVNKHFVRWLGYEKQVDLHGRNLADITDPQDRHTAETLMGEVVSGEREQCEIDRRFLTRQGDVKWGRINFTYNHGPQDVGPFGVAVIQDVSDIKRQEENDFLRNNYDSLTNLPNRALLMDRLQTQLLRTQRTQLKTFVMFIDLDGFKEVNDSKGHEIGDQVLSELSQRFASSCRASDTLARFGGDEFIVVAADIDHPEVVERIARSLLDAAREPVELMDEQITLSASIGIACYPTDADNPATLIQYADTAMYTAKNSGRDGIRFYSPRMNAQATRRLKIKQDLQKAIAHGRLVYELQPIVQLGDQKLVGAEMLVRLCDANGKILMPEQFIEIAEEGRLIDELGNWILDSAGQILSDWRARTSARDLFLSFNVSPRQFESGQLFERLEMWKELSPGLMMEVTERVLVNPSKKSIDAIQTFRERGGTVALDDFGAGYSGLNYLRNFPIDYVKLDGVLMRESTDGSGLRGDQWHFMDAIVELATAVNAKIIVEGVETQAQLDAVARYDKVWVQGYHIARPMDRTEFELMTTNPRIDRESIGQ
ncbi:MAG: EAL domain-containing protein [Burkholderiaceae bacterium]